MKGTLLKLEPNFEWKLYDVVLLLFSRLGDKVRVRLRAAPRIDRHITSFNRSSPRSITIASYTIDRFDTIAHPPDIIIRGNFN